MMVDGRQTLQEIERAIADLRTRESQAQSDLEAATSERMALLKKRTAAFRELAELRAKSAIADGVINEADGLQHQVASLLSARQRTIDTLSDRSKAANTDRTHALNRIEQQTNAIAVLELRLDEIGNEARQQLRTDPVYNAHDAVRVEAERVFKNANEKTKRAETDRKEKGAAYENDPLFMYLWKRRYGQAEPSSWALVRWLDDKIARFVNYHEARPNYAMLNEIPTRLRAHTEDLAEKLAAANADLAQTVAARINEIAGTDLTAELAAAHDQKAQTAKDIEAADAEIAEITRQLNFYAEGRDDGFRKAVEMSAGFLAQTQLNTLLRQARETTTPTDDEIVARIGELDRRREATDKRITQDRGELDKLSRRRQELLEVAAKFRRNHYDHPSSVFQTDDIAAVLLEALIRGAISGSDYWDRSRRQHGWRSRPADPFRRSSSLPPFGGSRDKGGFRTGGGF